jgi:hypothetical protein
MSANRHARRAAAARTRHNEAGLAEAFAEQYADEIKYVHELKQHKWFIKNTDGWEQDLTLRVLYLVQAACCDAAVRSGDPALARELCSAHTIYAVERLCRCQPKLAGSKADVGLPPAKRRMKVGVG